MRFSFHQWRGLGSSLLDSRAGLTLGPAGGSCGVLVPLEAGVYLPVYNHSGSHIGTYGSWHGSDVFCKPGFSFSLHLRGPIFLSLLSLPGLCHSCGLPPFYLCLAAILLCILASVSGYLLRSKIILVPVFYSIVSQTSRSFRSPPKKIRPGKMKNWE